MRFLLDLLYLVAAPLVLVVMLVPTRCFTRRRYFDGLGEKLLGPPRREGDRPCLWIHAVSVGEVRTALPLVRGLREALPDHEICLSTTTDTGRDVAQKAFAGMEPDVRVVRAPIDLSFSVGRALRAVRPRALILVELELWPNLLLGARRRAVPVYVVNGRLSERSARRYGLAGPLARFLFRQVDGYAVQDETYAARFRALGVAPERIASVGNLKYDARAEPIAPSEETRERLGWKGATVLMGGCTHPGEEEALLAAFSRLRRERDALRLILAPRHIERAASVAELAGEAAVGTVVCWSGLAEHPRKETAGNSQPPDVLVVDVIGELDRFYAVADIVFLGGTLVDHGGHNLLEPARLDCPVVLGPSWHNFEEVTRFFLERDAVIEVEDSGTLEERLEELLAEPDKRRALARRARDAAAELGGAVARHVEWLRERLGEGEG